jgi:putative Mg2+ transporter-C (MgtC) family protein
MPLYPTWPDILVRLLLTVIAGALMGFNRGARGHAAGLRTTILVTLAASLAMIQMNILLPVDGKTSGSFAVMDLMRLPLGILTGVGFIGAGAIVRKGDMVLGVTTAATLWFSTVVGLCLGGGQLILGSVSTVIGYLALTSLRRFEIRLEKYQPATLILVTTESSLTAQDLRARLQAAHFRVKSISVDHLIQERRQRVRCEVRWPIDSTATGLPALLQDLERTPGLERLSWQTASTSSH